MFKFSVEVIVPALSKHPIEISCPVCKLHTWVRLGDIQRGDVAICRGCHANIHLNDHIGQVNRAAEKIVRMIKRLEM